MLDIKEKVEYLLDNPDVSREVRILTKKSIEDFNKRLDTLIKSRRLPVDLVCDETVLINTTMDKLPKLLHKIRPYEKCGHYLGVGDKIVFRYKCINRPYVHVYLDNAEDVLDRMGGNCKIVEATKTEKTLVCQKEYDNGSN